MELYRLCFTNVVIFNNKSFWLFNFGCYNFSSTTYRSSHRRYSVTKSVLRNFTKFTEKHLHQNLFFNKAAGRRCSVTKGVLRNFAKFTRKHLCQGLFFKKVAGRTCSLTKGVHRTFENFTGKHLCQSLLFNKVAGLRLATLLKKRPCHRCFPVSFAKSLRSPFVTDHLRWLLLNISFFITIWKNCVKVKKTLN